MRSLPFIWRVSCGSETYGNDVCLERDAGEQLGVEGRLDELLEEDVDDAIELKDGVREFDGESDCADSVGFL